MAKAWRRRDESRAPPCSPRPCRGPGRRTTPNSYGEVAGETRAQRSLISSSDANTFLTRRTQVLPFQEREAPDGGVRLSGANRPYRPTEREIALCLERYGAGPSALGSCMFRFNSTARPSPGRCIFHQLEKETGQRVRNKRVGEDTDEEVPWEKIVKGYELAEGEFVIVTSEELESLAPAKSRTIKIEEFVDLADIDPIAWQQTYYLGPSDAVASAEPYALLHRAMVETKKVGIGRFVLRSKEHLATVRPIGRLLGPFYDVLRRRDPFP